MKESKPEIVLLLGPSRSSVFLYNYLKQHFTIQAAILENAVSRTQLIKRRAKKLGWPKVIGQLLFQIFVARILKITSAKRYRQLLSQYKLSDAPIDEEKIIRVNSVNDPATIELLRTLQPALIVINGTRIISKKTLEAVSCHFINTHAGITPKYRGVHGGYWALVNNDQQSCGVTIHLVDKGIDTGDIIDQAKINPAASDNFTTYPIHQLGAALPRLKVIIDNALANNLVTRKSEGESRLWHHPTLIQYFYYRFFKGVR